MFRKAFTSALICLSLAAQAAAGVRFERDFAPHEGLTAPQEKPLRDEICQTAPW